MGNILDIVGEFAFFHPWLIYLVIFIGSFIQGETTIFISFYLIINNYIYFFGFLIALLGGVFIGDITLYYLAGLLRDTKLGNKIHNHFRYREQIEFYLHNFTLSFLILSKFVFAANAPIMFLAGWTKIGFKKFIKSLTFTVILWLIVAGGLGYAIMSELNYLKTEKIFRQIEILILTLIILMFFTKKRLSSIFEKVEKLEKFFQKIKIRS